MYVVMVRVVWLRLHDKDPTESLCLQEAGGFRGSRNSLTLPSIDTLIFINVQEYKTP
jgi:hypothetical protein